MAGRSPARFLAPLALVAFAVALIMVIGASSSSDPEVERQPTTVENRTSTSNDGSSERKPARKRSSENRTSTYTIKPGDTPSGIASAHGMTTQELLELNPDIDPSALTVGDELKVK
jgi:LysM repeat protein